MTLSDAAHVRIPRATPQGVPRQAVILLYRLLLSHTGSFHQVIADVLRQRATPPPSPRGEDSASELTARQVRSSIPRLTLSHFAAQRCRPSVSRTARAG